MRSPAADIDVLLKLLCNARKMLGNIGAVNAR
jgi:hypothetical protein